MREDKAELRARVFLLEKERATIELKLNARDTQIAAQHAAIEHLQGQLSDTEAMLAMATNKVGAHCYSECFVCFQTGEYKLFRIGSRVKRQRKRRHGI